MLVLSRCTNESVLLSVAREDLESLLARMPADGALDIRVVIVGVRGDRVRVGLVAPEEIAISRPDKREPRKPELQGA